MRSFAISWLAISVWAVAAPAFGEDAADAADAFNAIYGEDIKRAAATASPADDVALAKQMLKDARQARNQPALLVLLCEKAYELGSKDTTGHATAFAAMQLLAENVRDKHVEALQKCVALYQRTYATARGDARSKAGEALVEALAAVATAQVDTGDLEGADATLKQAIAIATAIKSDSRAALKEQQASLAGRKQVEKELAALKAKLEADPKDDDARKELIRLYLVELDNPAEAARFVDESIDEATRKYTPAAAKGVDEAPELACPELGAWYRSLADMGSSASAKAAMLLRARAYYERFLDLHKAEDLARTTAALTLKKIEDALAKLPAAGAKSAGGWVDCLRYVDPATSAAKGKWEKKDGRLTIFPSGQPYERIAVPVAPQGSYELQITLVQKGGPDAVAVMLPAGPTACNVVFGAYAGAVSGLEMVKGNNADKNETTVKPSALPGGQECTATIKVLVHASDGEIAVELNGKPFIAWKGPLSALTPHPGWGMPDRKVLGLGAHNATVEFRRMRIRMLSGDVKLPDAPAAK